MSFYITDKHEHKPIVTIGRMLPPSARVEFTNKIMDPQRRLSWWKRLKLSLWQKKAERTARRYFGITR
jgi:hypothetical protein